MSKGRVRRTVMIAVLVLGCVTMAVPDAASEPADDIDTTCDPLLEVPEVGSRACGSIDALRRVLAQHCRRVPGLDALACAAIDGHEVHEAGMQAFEASWLARALALQRDLDLDVPLTAALIPHTHNSANSAASPPSVTTNDANQLISVRDQLRLGIRGIEIDVHWAPNPAGEPAHLFNEPVQCHGEPVATPLATVHAGCSVDRTLHESLAELRAWLDEPGHGDELVLLYLENVLDGDEAAHAEAVAAIEEALGDLVHRPTPGAGCQPLPVDRSKRDILEAGAQVLITGNCGPGGWTDWVFERGGAWDESGSSTDYLAGSTCDDERAAEDYEHRFIRRYEDSTWLSLMAGGGSHITAEVLASMVRCGVNLPGLDQVYSGDERLASFVWSWAPNEPLAAPGTDCALQRGTDARFVSADCGELHPVACRTVDGGWAISPAPSRWDRGDAACTAAGHAGAGVPANGWDNELLRRAAVGADVWLAYGRDGGGDWTIGIPPAAG